MTVYPVYRWLGQRVSHPEAQYSQAPQAHPSQGMATRSPSATVRTPGAEAFDDPDSLVAGDERRMRLDRPVPVGGVDVGVAQPAGLDLDHHLPWSGLWFGHLLDAQGLIEGVHDCSSHGYLLWVGR